MITKAYEKMEGNAKSRNRWSSQRREEHAIQRRHAIEKSDGGQLPVLHD